MKLVILPSTVGGRRKTNSSAISVSLSLILLIVFILGCCVDDVVSQCNTDPNAYLEDGFVRRCIETPGLVKERCYYLFIPPCAAADTVPLVLDMHGYSLCPEYNFAHSGWVEKAMKECFVVAYPTGNTSPLTSYVEIGGTCWNLPPGSLLPSKDEDTEQCCCFSTRSKGVTDLDDTQDPLFLRNVAIDVVDHLNAQKTKIDTKRIYMGGHSNGCMASLAMAALNSDIVAAVACHAGALITPFDSSPTSDNAYSPVPIWRVHGGSDSVVPIAGSAGDKDAPSMLPFNNATDYIVMKNGCSPNATTVTAVTDINGKNVGTSSIYSTDCVNNATVQTIVLPNSDHMPYFNRSDTAFEGVTINTTYESLTLVDTTQMAWDFCSLHSKPTIPEVFLMQSEAKPTTTITSDTTMKTAAPQEEEKEKEIENNDQQQASTTNTANTTASAGETISKTTIIPTGGFFALLLFLFLLY